MNPPRAARSRLLDLACSLLVLPALLAGCGSGSAPSAAAAAVCGNGIAEPGEECDDGNAVNSDGCLVTCQKPVSWVTSDPHVHSIGCSESVTPQGLAERLRAQQIQLAAALVWGEGYQVDSAFFTGRDHPLSSDGFILHYDLEVSHFAAAKTGHLLLLGLDSLRFSDDVFGVPQSGVPIVDWARRQPRAVVGMAHAAWWPTDGSYPVPPGGCCVPWEAVVHAARGRLDFLSTEFPLDREPGAFRLWRALQSAGYRVPLAGGSDWSCLAERFDDTTPRTDVIVDGAVSYESWLAALKAGRATMANGVGNRLNLRVEGRRMGDEVQLAAPGEVTVTLETQGRGGTFQVLVNGESRASIGIGPGAQVAQLNVPVQRSSWIAARAPFAMTNAVYVVVENRPIRDTSEICYLWRYAEHLEDLVLTGRLRLFASESEGLLAYREAIAALQRRFVESGGTTCPYPAR